MSYAENTPASGKLEIALKPLEELSKVKRPLQKYNLTESGQIIEVVRARVFEFVLSDVIDRDQYAQETIQDWINSEQGQFVINHAVEHPTWHSTYNPGIDGQQYAIIAHFTSRDWTFYTLKWGNKT